MPAVAPPAGLLATAPPQVPIEVTGDEARRKAVTELLDPVYAANQPPWWQRVASWVMERIADAIASLTGQSAGLAWALVLVAVVVLVVVVVVRRSGGLRGTARQHPGAPVGATRTAAEHRALAERAAAGQDWGTAVLERFRATVRVLEERGVLDERPGRTADEVAREAPVSGDDHVTMSVAAGVFDAVVYGEQAATEHRYALVVRADGLAARLVPQRATTTTTLAAPR